MDTASSRSDLNILWREADRAAAKLVRRFGLPAVDRADLCHDILADTLVRVPGFDPRRGAWGAFIAVIIQHSVARIAALLRRDRARFGMLSLDDPISGQDGATLLDTLAEDDGYLTWMGSSINSIAVLEDRLSINRALNTLSPKHISLCTDLVTGSIGRVGTGAGPSRATLYRQLHEVRLQLLAAGIGPRT